MKRTGLSVFLLFIIASPAAAQSRANVKAPLISRSILCGALIEPDTGQVRHNVLIVTEGDRIRQVEENGKPAPDSGVINLSDHTCLPGLVDAHTHTLLQGDITAEDYDVQLLKESSAYRAIL